MPFREEVVVIFNKIKALYNFYRYGLKIENLKITMTSETFDKLKADSECGIEFKEPITLFGCPVIINDKISTDFYICEYN